MPVQEWDITRLLLRTHSQDLTKKDNFVLLYLLVVRLGALEFMFSQEDVLLQSYHVKSIQDFDQNVAQKDLA